MLPLYSQYWPDLRLSRWEHRWTRRQTRPAWYLQRRIDVSGNAAARPSKLSIHKPIIRTPCLFFLYVVARRWSITLSQAPSRRRKDKALFFEIKKKTLELIADRKVASHDVTYNTLNPCGIVWMADSELNGSNFTFIADAAGGPVVPS